MRAHKTLTDFQNAVLTFPETPIPGIPCAQDRPDPKTLTHTNVELQISTDDGGAGPDFRMGHRVGRSPIAFDKQISNREFDPARISTCRREPSTIRLTKHTLKGCGMNGSEGSSY